MDPLGMTSSQYPPGQHKDNVRPEIWQAMSTGYTSMGSAWIQTIPVYFGEYPAGSVLARPSDHVRLLLAMMNDGAYNGYQVLKPETVERMLSPQGFDFEARPGASQGLIWGLSDIGKRTMGYSHAGGHMFGWSTQGKGWPQLDAAVMVAVNQWRIPDSDGEMDKITDFVGNWIASLPPDVEQLQASDDWHWKVSYVRGAVFAAAYSTWVRIPGDMPEEAINDSIEATRLIPHSRNDWRPDAFRQGIEDMKGTGLSLAGVTGFWQSEACKVSLDEAKTIYQELGGRIPGYMSMMFPPEPEN